MLSRYLPGAQQWRPGSAFWLAMLAWLHIAPALAAGGSPGIPPARDLAADLRLANANGLPVVVLFSRGDCAWCERVRQEYLLPLQRAESPVAVIREVDIDASARLVDFAGHRVASADFARRYQIRLAPTLMFFGASGQPAAEAIVGFRLADFYGAYLERAIKQAGRREP